jgi:hypothetical protein
VKGATNKRLATKPSNGELAMSRLEGMPIIPLFPLDLKLPWGILTKLQASTSHYIYQAWHILPSPSPQSFMNVGNGPPSLSPLDTKVIQ